MSFPVNSSSIPLPIARRLEDKVALITGGAQGIGEATARLFCRHGAKVVIADIQDDLGLAVCRSLDSKSSLFVHCDVTDDDDVRQAVDLAAKTFGKLDIIFNNAATADPHRPRILDADPLEFEQVLRVNVTGVFLGIKHAARVMCSGGSIINNGSVASVVGGVATHAYVASKHAVVGLTKSAAAELGRRGIRVNCLSPFLLVSSLTSQFFGNVDGVEKLAAGMSKLKGVVLTAEDIAQAAVYLGSDESRYVSGHNLVVDGGGFTTVNDTFDLFDK